MIATYNQLTEADREKETALENQLKELDKKIHRLRERYAIEEIDKEMYEEFGTKFLNERNEIPKQLAELADKVSNPEKCADTAIEYASNLATAWDLGGYEENNRSNPCSSPKECPTTVKTTSVEPLALTKYSSKSPSRRTN